MSAPRVEDYFSFEEEVRKDWQEFDNKRGSMRQVKPHEQFGRDGQSVAIRRVTDPRGQGLRGLAGAGYGGAAGALVGHTLHGAGMSGKEHAAAVGLEAGLLGAGALAHHQAKKHDALMVHNYNTNRTYINPNSKYKRKVQFTPGGPKVEIHHHYGASD